MRRLWIWCVGALVLAAGCTVPGAGGTDTTTTSPPSGPVINQFIASASTAPAPALIALSWKVSDSDGNPLTCRIDTDGDGIVDLTIPNCAGTGYQNTSFSSPGDHTATIEVDDGTTFVTGSAKFTISTGVSEPFDITVVPVGTGLNDQEQAAFDAAAAYWESVIVRGIPDLQVDLDAGVCLAGAPAIHQVVDDLVIQAEVTPIDGVGKTLGRAGPCAVASSDHLPRVGEMEFDSADVDKMLADGSFTEVVTHEMGHVLGFGTEWTDGRSLLSGAGGTDPRFVGLRADAAYAALGGTGTVPVENTGGPGTADAHWRESIFGNELMTGYINSGPNPLSAMSIASMADLGYQVDLSAAQPYSLPTGGAFSAQSSLAANNGIMLRPQQITLPG
jgi:hypothetical protein